MVGVHASELPDFGADDEIDDNARAQIRQVIDSLKANIKMAQSQNELELVERYETI